MQVSVVAGPGPNSPSGQVARPSLETWSPDARDFPLNIAVGFTALPSTQVQDEVRLAAGKAVGLNPGLGDMLALTTSSLQAPATPSVAAPAPSPAPQPPSLGQRIAAGISPALFWEVHLVPLLFVLLGAAFWLHRRRSAPRRLSEQQRARFALRLQALLEQGEARVAPRL